MISQVRNKLKRKGGEQMNWNTIADQQTLEKTVQALQSNGVNAVIVDTADEAKQKALELLPKGAEVMTMTSETLRIIGLESTINESGDYDAVKPKLYGLNELDPSQKAKLGAGPDYTIGSVHAVTHDGKVVVASNTGSQLAAYVYGAQHVIWVVGAQKVVENVDAAMKRIYDHVLPLESDRARKAYGTDGSNVSKLFILNKEVNPNRINMILVKESLGF
jgi:predicted RNA-binding protein with PIN domain